MGWTFEGVNNTGPNRHPLRYRIISFVLEEFAGRLIHLTENEICLLLGGWARDILQITELYRHPAAKERPNLSWERMIRKMAILFDNHQQFIGIMAKTDRDEDMLRYWQTTVRTPVPQGGRIVSWFSSGPS